MIHANLTTNGFHLHPDLLNPDEISILLNALANLNDPQNNRQKNGTYAIRNLLQTLPEVAALASSPKVQSIVHEALGPNAQPVRGTLFDKTPDANWLVPWHQDLTISVQQRIDTPGYGPWTIKAEVHSVQPPAKILDAMLAVRIHLDDCHEENGPLKILPGTHKTGRLSAADIDNFPKQDAVTCSISKGGALLMKPLVLHSSSPSQSPSHRRVIHIDFSTCQLPNGLKWLES